MSAVGQFRTLLKQWREGPRTRIRFGTWCDRRARTADGDELNNGLQLLRFDGPALTMTLRIQRPSDNLGLPVLLGVQTELQLEFSASKIKRFLLGPRYG